MYDDNRIAMKKIFCLPYAGGSAPIIYSKWKRRANNGMKIIPIELPGRGTLFGQKYYTTIKEAVDSVFDVFWPYSVFPRPRGLFSRGSS